MKKISQEYASLSGFLLEAPLYSEYEIPNDSDKLYELYGSTTGFARAGPNVKLDGYCSFCGRDTTFTLSPPSVPQGVPWNNLETRTAYDALSITCVRDENHRVRFYIRNYERKVMKIGQYPSLADIAINEVRNKYKSVLKGDNWSELYKAIGLAAHGEGIASFVYLRRVFERLIWQRFEEHSVKEKWDRITFSTLRMNERVDFLEDYLPNFLVQNAKLYSIFSLGIHELENEQCLAFFEAGKGSILFVLEDDLKKREDEDRRKLLSQAVAAFEGNTKKADIVG